MNLKSQRSTNLDRSKPIEIEPYLGDDTKDHILDYDCRSLAELKQIDRIRSYSKPLFSSCILWYKVAPTDALEEDAGSRLKVDLSDVPSQLRMNGVKQ